MVLVNIKPVYVIEQRFYRFLADDNKCVSMFCLALDKHELIKFEARFKMNSKRISKFCGIFKLPMTDNVSFKTVRVT